MGLHRGSVCFIFFLGLFARIFIPRIPFLPLERNRIILVSNSCTVFFPSLFLYFSGLFAALTAYIEARKAGLKGGIQGYFLVGVFIIINFITIAFVTFTAPSYSIAIGHYLFSQFLSSFFTSPRGRR